MTREPMTDETLMAFADGELDAAQNSQVAHAIEADPALRGRVDQMRQQRNRIGAAFAAVVDEPVPDRLSRLLQTPSTAAQAPVQPASDIVDLAEARAARADASARARARVRMLPTWAQLGGMAASVVLGVLLGARFLGGGLDPAMGLQHGQLVAGGAIDQALSTQLASEPAPGASVAVQLSFVDRGGSYCRTFSTGSTAGLACQQGGHWVVQQINTVEASGSGPVRQATTAMPPALLDAVDRRMAHGTLDSDAERQARARGWQP